MLTAAIWLATGWAVTGNHADPRDHLAWTVARVAFALAGAVCATIALNR